jgi:hypothetical protein
MKIKRSYLFAGGIGLAVVGYFAVSSVMGRGDEAKAEKAKAAAAAKVPDGPQLVRVVETAPVTAS